MLYLLPYFQSGLRQGVGVVASIIGTGSVCSVVVTAASVPDSLLTQADALYDEMKYGDIYNLLYSYKVLYNLYFLVFSDILYHDSKTLAIENHVIFSLIMHFNVRMHRMMKSSGGLDELHMKRPRHHRLMRRKKNFTVRH